MGSTGSNISTDTGFKPKLTFAQIWNMSFGFLGIQMGFALQNANASRILQIFGADVHELSWFWLVAPLTGMIVQPIIGHYSDNTWTKLGRRRPYFLGGALLASLGMVFLPNAGIFVHLLPALWIGAGFLMIMDAAFNIAMEPFRALVADKLPNEQRTMGFSIQTVLIGIGAIIGSTLPWVLTNWIGMPDTAGEGEVSLSLKYAFVLGAVALIATIIWTVVKTKEYPPEGKTAASPKGLLHIAEDFKSMPKTMKQLGLTQFFSWFALFSMWVYTTPAIAHHIYKVPLNDTSSKGFSEAGDWVGILFGAYNLVSTIYAFMLPSIAKKYGRKRTHFFSLLLGGIGLMSFYIIENEYLLLLPMIGVGIAWASILAMPYAILAGSIPPKKMGVYMGIFNFFITLPQIINGIFGGPIVKYIYQGNPIYAIVFAGVFMIIAGFSVLKVKDVETA